jgi:hypothetical protein
LIIDRIRKDLYDPTKSWESLVCPYKNQHHKGKGMHEMNNSIPIMILNVLMERCPQAEFKELTWAPGYYVSDSGRVFSARSGPLRELKPWLHALGYPQVHLFPRNQKDTVKCIHYLVAELYLSPAEHGQSVIRHKDGNPGNNNATNLEWGTIAENMADRSRHNKTAAMAESLRGRKKKKKQQNGIPFTSENTESELKRLVALWPQLPLETREKIIALIQPELPQKNKQSELVIDDGNSSASAP